MYGAGWKLEASQLVFLQATETGNFLTKRSWCPGGADLMENTPRFFFCSICFNCCDTYRHLLNVLLQLANKLGLKKEVAAEKC
jgi:hypothetical protein